MTIDERVTELIAESPDLTDDQIDQAARILAPEYMQEVQAA